MKPNDIFGLLAALAVADGRIEEPERRLLESMARKWELPAGELDRIIEGARRAKSVPIPSPSDREEARVVMALLVEMAVADRRVNAREFAFLHRAASALGSSEKDVEPMVRRRLRNLSRGLVQRTPTLAPECADGTLLRLDLRLPLWHEVVPGLIVGLALLAVAAYLVIAAPSPWQIAGYLAVCAGFPIAFFSLVHMYWKKRLVVDPASHRFVVENVNLAKRILKWEAEPSHNYDPATVRLVLTGELAYKNEWSGRYHPASTYRPGFLDHFIAARGGPIARVMYFLRLVDAEGSHDLHVEDSFFGLRHRASVIGRRLGWEVQECIGDSGRPS